MHRFPRTATFFLASLLTLPAAAQEAAPPRDFGPGFRRFHAMGLPRTQGARLVKFEGGGQATMSTRMGGLPDDLGLDSHAWLLEEAADGSEARILLPGGREVRMVRSRGLSRERAREIWASHDRVLGEWSPAEAAPLLDALARVLEGAGGDGEGPEDDGSSRLDFQRIMLRSRDTIGQLLLWLAMCHDAGFEAPANRAAAALFDLAPRPQVALLAAVSALADGQYAAQYERFSAAGDWAAFGAAIDDLLKRFPQGWRKAPAVVRLREAVRRREAGAALPEGLGPDAQAVARALLDAKPGEDGPEEIGSLDRLWTLRPPKAPAADAGAVAAAVAGLNARGADAIPVWTELAKADLLCAALGAQSRDRFVFSVHDDMETVADPEELYASLPRPASVAELAAAQLAAILPGREDDEPGKPDAVSLAADAREFHERIRGKDRLALARIYWDEGNDAQSGQALRVLAREGGPEVCAEIERRILEGGERNYERMQLAREYVAVRGAAARDFVERLAPLVGTSEDDIYERHVLAALREETNADPPADLVAALLERPAEAEETLGKLANRLGRWPAPPDEQLDLLLPAVRKAPTLRLAAGLRAAWSRGRLVARYRRMSDDDEDDENEVVAEIPSAAPVERHRPLWAALLDDDDPAGFLGLRRLAAEWIGELADTAETPDAKPPDEERETGDGPRMPPEQRDRWLAARARAWLAGQPLPPPPLADRVPEARRAELAAGWEGAPLVLARRLADLDADAMAFLEQRLAADPAENARIAPAARTIYRVAPAERGLTVPPEILALEGRTLDRALADELTQWARRRAGQGMAVLIRMGNGGGGNGLRLSYEEYPAASAAAGNLTPGRQEALDLDLVAGSVQRVSLPLRDAAAPAAPAAAPADDLLGQFAGELAGELQSREAETLRAFHAALDGLAAAHRDVFQPIAFIVTAVPAPPAATP